MMKKQYVSIVILFLVMLFSFSHAFAVEDRLQLGSGFNDKTWEEIAKDTFARDYESKPSMFNTYQLSPEEAQALDWQVVRVWKLEPALLRKNLQPSRLNQIATPDVLIAYGCLNNKTRISMKLTPDAFSKSGYIVDYQTTSVNYKRLVDNLALHADSDIKQAIVFIEVNAQYGIWVQEEGGSYVWVLTNGGPYEFNCNAIESDGNWSKIDEKIYVRAVQRPSVIMKIGTEAEIHEMIDSLSGNGSSRSIREISDSVWNPVYKRLRKELWQTRLPWIFSAAGWFLLVAAVAFITRHHKTAMKT